MRPFERSAVFEQSCVDRLYKPPSFFLQIGVPSGDREGGLSSLTTTTKKNEPLEAISKLRIQLSASRLLQILNLEKYFAVSLTKGRCF